MAKGKIDGSLLNTTVRLSPNSPLAGCPTFHGTIGTNESQSSSVHVGSIGQPSELGGF